MFLIDMNMKKILVYFIGGCLLLSSCDTYTGTGAYAGGTLGSVLGSAIGGLSGGPRGSDMGTIIGMVGGAAVGAAIGSQADQKRSNDIDQYERDRAARRSQNGAYGNSQYGNSGRYDRPIDEDMTYHGSTSDSNKGIFDSTNSGDDRLYDFNGKDYVGDYSAQAPKTSLPSSTVTELGNKLSYSPNLDIVNARFVDDNEDGKLNRNETCKLIFEIMNRGTQPVCDVVPTVVETTGNKHIFISPSIHVEEIAPGRGVRYTAMVKADSRLKGDHARFCVSVVYGGKAISKINEFNIPIDSKKK